MGVACSKFRECPLPWGFSGLPGGSLPEKMTQFLAQALLPLLAFVFTGSTYAIFTILDILFNEILFETTREYFYFRLSMTGSYKAAFLPESWQVYGSVLLRFGSFLDPSSHHDLFCDPPSYKIFQTWVSDPSEPQASQYTSRAFSSFPEFFLCLAAARGEREKSQIPARSVRHLAADRSCSPRSFRNTNAAGIAPPEPGVQCFRYDLSNCNDCCVRSVLPKVL